MEQNNLMLITNDNSAPTTESRAVAFFDKRFSTELAALLKADAEFVFDYTTKKGRDEATSHIYKLKRSRVAIEKSGKEERSDALAYQKAVIVAEDKITSVIQERIDHHQKPLDEWETKESNRIETIRSRIDGMKVDANTISGKTSVELKTMLSDLATIVTGEGFDEFAD